MRGTGSNHLSLISLRKSKFIKSFNIIFASTIIPYRQFWECLGYTRINAKLASYFGTLWFMFHEKRTRETTVAVNETHNIPMFTQTGKFHWTSSIGLNQFELWRFSRSNFRTKMFTIQFFLHKCHKNNARKLNWAISFLQPTLITLQHRA